MSDLDQLATAALPDDAIHRQIVVMALVACRRWAIPHVTARLDVLLYPRDRGPVDRQRPYLVQERTVEQGIWKILLCPLADLPAGVPQSSRDDVLKAQIARNALKLPLPAVDHVIQCGLFGEVLY